MLETSAGSRVPHGKSRKVRNYTEENQDIKNEGGKSVTQKEFNDVVVSQTERCKSLLTAKGSEYSPKAAKGTSADRLAHFKKAAVVMNSTPKSALMGMLSKHLISVSDMCTEEKITDSINYLLILRALIEEETHEED